jgi:cardiolipin synthase A/B
MPPGVSPLDSALPSAPVPGQSPQVPGAVAPQGALRSGPSFVRGLWRVAAAQVSSGNRVRLLRDGPPTFEAMLDMIANAKSNVSVEQYIFRGDEVGNRFADALLAARQRGVDCRVLVDWIGIRGTPRSFFRRLRSAGVVVRVFNPFGLHRWLGIVPRDHRKLLVVDAECGVTGGIGIGTEWRTGVLKRPSASPGRRPRTWSARSPTCGCDRSDTSAAAPRCVT